MSLQRKVNRRKLEEKRQRRLSHWLDKHRKLFIDKFGREPTDDDPLIWDPSSDTPKQMSLDDFHDDVLRIMAASEMPGHLIHAWQKTGRILTEDTYHLVSPADRKEWDDAIQEYFDMQDGPRH